MEEIWKDILGFEGYYQISNLGRVKSLPRKVFVSNRYFVGYRNKKEHILSTRPGKIDYVYVILCKEGTQVQIPVHRLVAQAFIPNPDNLPEVNHIDENRHNNNITNLEWCTHQYNSTCGTIKERQRLKSLNHKHSETTKKIISDKKKEWWKTHKIISV